MNAGHGRQVSTQYLEEQIRNESPVARVARILEMGCAQLARARAALAAGDTLAKGTAVERASRCVALLQDSLNMDEGGEVAANLDRLYTYLQGRITEGHVRNEDAPFEEVLGHLTELASAWRQAAESHTTAADETAVNPSTPESRVAAP